MNHTLAIVLIILGSGILEFIISFFFNYKIFWIAKENFLLAGIYGAIATFLYMIMSGAVVYFSAANNSIWIIIVSAFVIAIGNFTSTLAVKHWEKMLLKRKKSKKSNLDSSTLFEVDFTTIEDVSFIAFIPSKFEINLKEESNENLNITNLDFEAFDQFILK